MSTTQLATKAFVKNRAEELGIDLWDDFIVPLYFDKLAIDEVGKPLLIEGGRGCGKTTLLRYLSYETQLSPHRKIDKKTLPKQLGIYYRSDTQYLRTFRGDALTDEKWHKAFEHELCLAITQSIFGALRLLTQGAERELEFHEVLKLDFSIWRDFDDTAPITLLELEKHVRSQRNKFSMWLNNPESTVPPAFLPLRPLLLGVIQAIRAQIECLSNMIFFVFIDEYENLLDYQMRAINTRLKHSENPLIFHIAAKRNGMATRKTVGDEQLQERDDFRRIDIEALAEDDFSLFAAELFCFRLRKSRFLIGPDVIDQKLLCSTARIAERRDNKSYKDETINAAKSILPGLNNLEVAKFIFADATLNGRLKRNLDDVLSKADSSLQADQFLTDKAPMEAICASAIIHQGKPAKEVLAELKIAATGNVSRFKTAEWTHHYFAGCVYHLFMTLPRPCVMYSGFETFLRLSRGNTRHFLELCHLSMRDAKVEMAELKPISYEAQAVAARSASALFIKETQGSGDHGNRLFHVVHALGQIFRLSQARPSQSEFERTHFALSQGNIDVRSMMILSECVKWSILFPVPGTKAKAEGLETYDYLFNPIFAPYFGISFNKGRKLELKPSHFDSLANGDNKALDDLIKEYAKNWQLSEQDQMNLFQGDTA
jgi:hypothetical protein